MSSRWKADLALAACCIAWGATFVVVQDALRDASVLMFLAIRFSLAAALMAVIFHADVRRMTRTELGAGALLGLVLFLGYFLQTHGLRFTTAAKAGFINASAVVLVPILLVVVLRQKVKRWVWAGVLAAFVGLALLSLPAEAALDAGFTAINPGDAMVFACAVMWAVHILLVARYTKQFSVGALSTLQIAVTALFALALAPILDRAGWEPLRLVWTTGLAWRLALTAIVCTAIAFSVQVWAQRHTSPAHVAVLLTLEPVFAALTAWWVHPESAGWSARSWLGAALILAGILLAELAGPQAVPESPAGGPPVQES